MDNGAYWTILLILPLLVSLAVAYADEQDEQKAIIDQNISTQQNLIQNPDIPVPGSIEQLHSGNLTEQQKREQKLWGYLKNDQLEKFQTVLESIRSEHPEWQPSLALLREFENTKQRKLIATAIKSKSHGELITLYHRYPGRFRCVEVHHLWALAESYFIRNELQNGTNIYRRIITSCASAKKRLVTLYKAEQNIPLAYVIQLLGLEDRRPVRTKSIEKEFQDYRYRIYLLAANQADQKPTQTLSYLKRIEADIISRRDTDAARLFANTQDVLADKKSALTWLEYAADWSGDMDNNITLVRRYLKAGDKPNAELLIKNIEKSGGNSNPIKVEIALDSARHAYAKKDYQQTLSILNTIKKIDAQNPESRHLSAWTQYHLQRYDIAAREFENIYRQAPAMDVARGLVFSLFHAEKLPHLLLIEKELSGPLSNLLPDDKVIARIETGKTPQELQLTINESATIYALPSNLPESQIAMAFAGRSKSGESGTSQMRLNKIPIVYFHSPAGESTEWSLQLDRVTIDAGSPAQGTLIGSDATGSPGQINAPTSELNNSIESVLRLRHTTNKTLFAAFGFSATNGEVDGNLQGAFGIEDFQENSGWQLALTKTPVRESLLSYTGLLDPFSQTRWGGVSRTALETMGYHSIDSNWQWSGSLIFAQLAGEGVKDNSHFGLYAKANRNLTVINGQEFNIGPYVLYQSYQDNLSKFTLGHGGYFSPQQLAQLGISGHYLSKERKRFLWQTDFAFGYQHHKEDSVPYFPLAPDGQTYAGNSDNGVAAQLDIAGVKQIGATSWQLAAVIRARVSPQYNDLAGMVLIRYLFSERYFTLRRDLPNDIFNSLY